MKVIITKYLDRIKLIKFFRSIINNITLSEAIYCVDRLPYVFDNLNKADVNEIQKKIKNCALFLIEEDEEDVEFCSYNSNIDPPQEYLDALVWYESCSEEHKQYIDQIVLWRSRPAVC